MSTTKNPETLARRVTEDQEKLLRANGWEFVMWRWYWVWRKDVHDASFRCLRIDDALRVEGALQATDKHYPGVA